MVFVLFCFVLCGFYLCVCVWWGEVCHLVIGIVIHYIL